MLVHETTIQTTYYFVLQGDCETLLKKIDEVRLLESRKSARLINSDTDFSKLADLNISQSNVTAEARKAISKAIEVPQHRSDYVQISGYVIYRIILPTISILRNFSKVDIGLSFVQFCKLFWVKDYKIFLS